jgi:methylated-DNA-[protein]-cysteine S-methyltransferase
MRYTHVESPIDRLLLVGEPGTLAGLYVADHEKAMVPDATWVEDADAFTDVIAQLEEYFAGERTEFDVALEPRGTEFQQAVWSALQAIPYGETMGYGELARCIGRPKASRAVGAANGRNPISIIIPCHRVIGADGSLTGYGWGTTRKSWLLDHERATGRPFA